MLIKWQNAVNFRDDKAVADVKLQISIMSYVFLFPREIWDQLLSGFPVFID